jgi:glycosyltransferase involved in cell wall biosynthesis
MGAFIGEALESIGNQTCADWELLAVDDCAPDDGTRSIIEAFAQRFPVHRVEYLRHETNLGVSAARNTAIDAARGQFVAFLDPDDVWMPAHLERALSAFHKDPATVLIASPHLIFGNGTSISAEPACPIPDWKKRFLPSSLTTGNFIQPSAAVARRAAVIAIGGFDTSPEIQHIEDYDLWIRLAKTGGKFVILDQVGCAYRKHAAQATSDRFRMNQRQEVLFAKHQAFFLLHQGRLMEAAFSCAGSPKYLLKQFLKAFTRRLFSRG